MIDEQFVREHVAEFVGRLRDKAKIALDLGGIEDIRMTDESFYIDYRGTIAVPFTKALLRYLMNLPGGADI